MPRTDKDDKIDLGGELGELYAPYEDEKPEVWTIEEIFSLLGYSEIHTAEIGDGSYGYSVVLCTNLDQPIKVLLRKLGYEQQEFDDLWAKEIADTTPQLRETRLAGVIKLLIEILIDEFGYKYHRMHQMCLGIEEGSAPQITSTAYTLIPSLRKSSVEDRKASEFLSVLYRGFCEPFKNASMITESCKNLITDINRFRHHFSGHDLEIPGDPNRPPHKKIKDVESRLRKYIKKTSLTQEIDVLIFKYNLLKSLDDCLADICDELERIPLE